MFVVKNLPGVRTAPGLTSGARMSARSLTPSPELGQYELLGKIAEGGMGAVYRGRHKGGGPVVAIKVLPPETARNQLLLKRFEQEFRAAALIDHPNVVKAIEYCGTPPAPFLVMEYVDGCTVGEKVDRDGAMGEADAVHVIRQVCDGLHCAHKQGLIHRDVKPDNILLTPDLTAKITDLGLVRDVESDENLTRTGRGLGTPHFMAPEQFRNAKSVDARSDVYALGATLYMMVTGKVPFDKCSPLDCWVRKSRDDFPAPKAVAAGVSDRLDFAIRRAMRANPAERPSSCREFMEDVLGGSWTVRPSDRSSFRLAPLPAADGLWYMVYYQGGQPRTVKGDTDTIRRNAQGGALGDLGAVLVSRSKAGPFAPLKNVPEFRDLVWNGGSGTRLAPVTVNPRLHPITPRSPSDPTPTSTYTGGRTPSDAPPKMLTEELIEVPLTTEQTLDLGSDERPRISTTRILAAPPPPPAPPAAGVMSYWWLVPVVAVAILIGAVVGVLIR